MRKFGSNLVLAIATGLLAAAAAETLAGRAYPSAVPSVCTCACANNEAGHIQDAMNRFNSALSLRDMREMQAAGIEPVSTKAWQRFFRDNPRATVFDNCSSSDLFISGDSATWNCVERVTIVSNGKVVPFVNPVHVTFSRKGGEWLIAGRK